MKYAQKVIFILFIMIIFSPKSSLAIGEQDFKPQDTFAGKFEMKCYHQNIFEADRAACYYKATLLWDKELNKYYKLLMGKLHKKQQVNLKLAQIKWVKFRDAEIKSNESIENAFNLGSGFGVLNLELTRYRALQLKSWYDYLKTLQ